MYAMELFSNFPFLSMLVIKNQKILNNSAEN